MKIKALLYCTKALPNLLSIKDEEVDFMCNYKKWLTDNDKKYKHCSYNGKIVCECEVETEEIEDRVSYFDSWFNEGHHTKNMTNKELEKRSCLSYQDLCKYLGEGEPNEVVGYALHLSNVKERVMELYKVTYIKRGYDFGEFIEHTPITKAPQNMMWVWIKENGKWVKYLLISVRSQWLCKILNGKKDIEVRRKVLKGMVE